MTNRIEIENTILDSVENGIKGVDLVAWINKKHPEASEVMDIIFDLIARGEIVEVEYELPHMSYRTKSFLLPKGTVINIINKVRVR